MYYVWMYTGVINVNNGTQVVNHEENNSNDDDNDNNDDDDEDNDEPNNHTSQFLSLWNRG